VAEAPFLSRQERFPLVPSTNDVVRGWLATGTPEVCVAVADEQSAGRGREGRAWFAPSGRALLLSLGFRPGWLAPEHAWRLAAVASLAMADAAEEVAGLRDGTVRLKWPNDLVVVPDDNDRGGLDRAAKLAGVLGETEGLGTDDPRVVVGLGINGHWPALEFPVELAEGMTSLYEASGGRPIDHGRLLEAFLDRLEPRVMALRDGRFDAGGWLARQATNGRLVRLGLPGDGSEIVRAVGVDPASGALLVEDGALPGRERAVLSAEVTTLRLQAVAGAEAGSGV
jgi:BirA family biotin operon repressor/biotin-[acetyl-CoA-carboxylase] ligase